MSLKSIAKEANTSIATVSRVLNNPEYHCHSKELEDKIWKLAKDMNYLPNEAARSLRTSSNSANTKDKTFTVDVLLTRFQSIDEDAFFGELFQILREELIGQNCNLGDVLNSVDIARLENSSEPDKSVPYRSHGKVMSEKKSNISSYITRKKHYGLIIFGKCPVNLIPVLKKRYAYIVGVDRNPTEYEYDEVICDGTTAAQQAMDYLIKLGHRNIAYIGDCNYESRYIGYYQSLLNYKIPLSHENIYPTRQTREEGANAMRQLLTKKTFPSAIFCANDETALGVLEVLKKRRKKGYTPSVISIDNIKESERTSPMLTTIDIPKRVMIHFALQLILDRRNGYHSEEVRIEVPCRLLERESCYYYEGN